MSFPLPRLEDVIDAIGMRKAKYFTVLDLYSSYYKFHWTLKQHNSALIVSSGIYTYNRMPFGLMNAPAAFQMVMSQVLRGLAWDYVIVYVNDIIIFSNTFEEHMLHFSTVFERLLKAVFTIKPSKCSFARPEVTYLGHIFFLTKMELKQIPQRRKRYELFRCQPTRKHCVVF
jgi:hypothetical protein